MRVAVIIAACLLIAASAVGQYSQLDVTITQLNGKFVKVQGSTDLPNDARLKIMTRVMTQSGEERVIPVTVGGTPKFIHVWNGKFETSLKSPYYGGDTKNYKQGDIEVWMIFMPSVQNEKVQGLVGSNGENLSGNLVDTLSGHVILRRTVSEPVKYGYDIPEYNSYWAMDNYFNREQGVIARIKADSSYSRDQLKRVIQDVIIYYQHKKASKRAYTAVYMDIMWDEYKGNDDIDKYLLCRAWWKASGRPWKRHLHDTETQFLEIESQDNLEIGWKIEP